jgi:glycine betaine/proline transport system substrate-binding protein
MGLTACQPPSETPTDSSQTPAETALPGVGKTVRSGYDAIALRMIAEIVNIGLEQLGYQVEELQQVSSPALLHAALASNDIDFTPVHADVSYAKFLENSGGETKLDRVGVINDQFKQGYQIDRKTAEEYNITNIEQLKDPEIAQLFDADGDGKADLSGCQAGWGCDQIIEHHLDAYKLRDTVEHNQGEFTTLFLDVIARYKQGKPIIFYSWEPSWQSQELKSNEDVVWLEVPFTTLPEMMAKYTEKDTVIDRKNLGFPIERLRVVATDQFLAANPSAKRWFEVVQIPVEDINAEMWRVHNGSKDPQEIRQRAEAWVQENQELFNSWLEAAKNPS